jgi:hypothetical protein
MSEAKPLTAGIEAPDAEVELNAQDLLELSGPCDNDSGDNKGREPQPQARTMVVSVMPSAPVAKKRPATTASRRPRWLETLAALLILAVGTAGALYLVSSNYRAGRSAAQERAPRSQLPASASKGEGKPVLFANPFDGKEVFEFPAGTTEAEARDQVAEILMERAMERQRKFDARVSSNR